MDKNRCQYEEFIDSAQEIVIGGPCESEIELSGSISHGVSIKSCIDNEKDRSSFTVGLRFRCIQYIWILRYI